MELLLIRHGRSRADDEGRVEGGGYDAPLTETGLCQARLLVNRLEAEAYRPAVLYSSPLCRAKQVADMVSAAVEVPVTVDDRLAEQHTGQIAGLTFEEAGRANPRPPGGFRTYVPIPGGESLYDQLSRVLHFYAELLDHHSDHSVCVVTHGGTISLMLNVIYGLPLASPFTDRRRCRFPTGDTGMHKLTINGPNDVVTHFLNDTSHLRGT